MTPTQITRLISMAGVTIKKAISKTIRERVQTRLCLHCDAAASKRGLCHKHYMQYRRQMLAQPKSKRAEFESEAIRDGLIIEASLIRELLDTDNPFRALGAQ